MAHCFKTKCRIKRILQQDLYRQAGLYVKSNVLMVSGPSVI